MSETKHKHKAPPRGWSNTPQVRSESAQGVDVLAEQYHFEALEAKYGLPKGLLATVCLYESVGKADAMHVGSNGQSSIGLMQLELKTAAKQGILPEAWLSRSNSGEILGVAAAHRAEAVNYLIENPQVNVDGAAIYLQKLGHVMDQYNRANHYLSYDILDAGGHITSKGLRVVLAAYNTGPEHMEGNLSRYGEDWDALHAKDHYDHHISHITHNYVMDITTHRQHCYGDVAPPVVSAAEAKALETALGETHYTPRSNSEKIDEKGAPHAGPMRGGHGLPGGPIRPHVAVQGNAMPVAAAPSPSADKPVEVTIIGKSGTHLLTADQSAAAIAQATKLTAHYLAPEGAKAKVATQSVLDQHEVLRHDKETVKDIQRLLKHHGLYSGPIDGIYGIHTFNGVKTYEQPYKKDAKYLGYLSYDDVKIMLAAPPVHVASHTEIAAQQTPTQPKGDSAYVFRGTV